MVLREKEKSVITDKFTTMTVTFRAILLLTIHLQAFNGLIYHTDTRLNRPQVTINYTADVEYRQTSNIRRTLIRNKNVDHSPVGAVPTTSSVST